MSVCFPSAAHRRRSAKPSRRERVYPALPERVAAGRPGTLQGRREKSRGKGPEKLSRGKEAADAAFGAFFRTGQAHVKSRRDKLRLASLG